MKKKSQSLVYLLSDNQFGLADGLAAGLQLRCFRDLEELVKAAAQHPPSILVYDLDYAGTPDAMPEEQMSSTCCVTVSRTSNMQNRLQTVRLGCKKQVIPDDLIDFINGFENGPEEQWVTGRILLVDDDATVLKYLPTVLNRHGFEVETLQDPMHVLEALESYEPDLLVLDLLMPNCSGTEVARVLRMEERYSHLPVIFLSSETNLEKQKKALCGGADDFVEKPIDNLCFINLVAARLQRARSLRQVKQGYEKALYEMELQQQALNQHAIVSIADAAGDIIYVNDKFCKISGYPREELIGQNHRILKSGVHDNLFFEQMWETISGGKVWQGTICNSSKSGRKYWVESTIVPFMGKDGMPYKYISVRTDITAMRTNEIRLLLSQKFAEIGTWDWNIATGELYWSELIGPLFGYTKTVPETTYENFINAVHPDDRNSVELAVNDCIKHGKHYDIEHRVVWDDGQIRWVHESGDVMRASDGQPLHMLGVVMDITARKEAEARLERSERQNSLMLNSMGEGMFGIDTSLTISFINYAASYLLGYETDELIGCHISVLCGDEAGLEAPNTACNIVKTVRDAMPIYAMDSSLICKDGSVAPVSLHSSPVIYNGKVTGGVVTFNDITGRLRHEAELIKAKEEAETANKAKSQFLSSMSHELRTPLNAIIGFGQLLQMADDNLDILQKENVGEILKAGKHLLELIDEILDLAKIESGQMQILIETVSIIDVLIECLSLIEPLASKQNIKIIFVYQDKEVVIHDLDPDYCLVQADRLRLKQALLNLLSNAIKYNREEGKVYITCNYSSDSLQLGIMNTGRGLNNKQMAEMFQPFNRLGAERTDIEGTGMGLIITRRLVEFMGGDLKCESEPGVGTSFTINLVTGKSDTESETDEKSRKDLIVSKADTPAEQYNILYIEDDPANIRLMAKIMLRQEHINLWTVHEPILGLDILAENRPDLVLLDINLPVMDGFEVIKRIREAMGDTLPIIAVSANAMPKNIEKSMAAGFDAYITKPIDVQKLLTEVNNFLGVTSE